ncbi:unnamed protein product [Heligmosomoides polygyrus]|uniref:FPG-type domain-containing protein n=1 Tax=Heligmosomoides polygyrus TaxID=6339 RepID=A0A183G4G7_HELPZ|nr:unnamed protein product [Heligmosomoides polygyrus]
MALQALYHNRRQEELRDFKLKDVFEKLNIDAADFQEWLRRIGLLATPLCPNCNNSMQIYQPIGDRYGTICILCHYRSAPENPCSRGFGEIGDYDLDSLSHRYIP